MADEAKRERWKAASRRYAEKHPDRVAKRHHKRYECDKENLLAKQANYHRLRRDNADDTYIKLLLTNHTGLSFEDIPDELVAAKRQQILLYRASNEKR